ncbi:MAG TPA: hypothetical protein VNE82_21590, partial [Candidatus Binataceae bacterium]|nr:hypothetical protein [Candidatus Binataceae bacterium]
PQRQALAREPANLRRRRPLRLPARQARQVRLAMRRFGPAGCFCPVDFRASSMRRRARGALLIGNLSMGR